MKRQTLLFCVLALILMYGCSTVAKEKVSSPSQENPQEKFVDVSHGLPTEGLWREKIDLFDVNNDGYLDIVAPPQRKAKPDQKKPSLFLWDNSARKWSDAKYRFPEINDYDYGAVAVGDINNDGYPDIALALHAKRVVILLNDKSGGFVESPFPFEGKFGSRSIELADINNDGLLDVIALGDMPTMSKDVKLKDSEPGILVGINKGGTGWNVSMIEESRGIFGNSLVVSDIDNDGNKDIIIAPWTTRKEHKKIVWLGDGKGNFKFHSHGFTESDVTYSVKKGYLTGDGNAELVFLMSGVGAGSRNNFSVFSWSGAGPKNVSPASGIAEIPLAFDLADIDGDKRDELIAVTSDGLIIYKYTDKEWLKLYHLKMPPAATEGVSDIKARKQKDGSWLIVYALGSEKEDTVRGLKAYVIR